MTDFHGVIGSNCNDMAIESRMVQFAERNPVRDNWFTTRIRIRNNMRRLEEFLVSESADCAMLSICSHDILAKPLLVKSPSGYHCNV